MDRFAPPGVVVDNDMQIVQFRGQTGPFLEPAPGEASLNLLKFLDNVIRISFKTVCCFCVVCTAIAFVVIKGRWLKEILTESKEKTDRYTTPEEYKTNLGRFITETRNKKAPSLE